MLIPHIYAITSPYIRLGQPAAGAGLGCSAGCSGVVWTPLPAPAALLPPGCGISIFPSLPLELCGLRGGGSSRLRYEICQRKREREKERERERERERETVCVCPSACMREAACNRSSSGPGDPAGANGPLGVVRLPDPDPGDFFDFFSSRFFSS